MLFVFMAAFFSTSFIPQPTETVTEYVRVGAGNTVWEIAEKLYSPNEVRSFEEFIFDIRKDNGLLGNNVLQAGQLLEVRIIKKK